MTTQAARGSNNKWRVIGWSLAAALLMLPLLAMQVTSEVNWDETDFIAAGIMLAVAGGLVELGARAKSGYFRAGVAVAVLTAFLLVWVNLAVGFLGSEDNPANLMFLGVLTTALAGAILVRFRAAAMSGVMATTAAAQVLAGAVGLAFGWASPGGQGVYEVVMGSSGFGVLWLASAWLFSRAAAKTA